MYRMKLLNLGHGLSPFKSLRLLDPMSSLGIMTLLQEDGRLVIWRMLNGRVFTVRYRMWDLHLAF